MFSKYFPKQKKYFFCFQKKIILHYCQIHFYNLFLQQLTVIDHQTNKVVINAAIEIAAEDFGQNLTLTFNLAFNFYDDFQKNAKIQTKIRNNREIYLFNCNKCKKINWVVNTFFQTQENSRIFFFHRNSQQFLNSVIIFWMMFFEKFKILVKRSDLFYSSQMLRYENQMEYKSLTGGILSLALIITVLIGFANMIILTMRREMISSQKEIKKNSDPPFLSVQSSAQNKFMMGIQVYGVDLSAPHRYFDYKFQEVICVGGQAVQINDIPLVQCTKQHWAQLPDVANSENLKISNWLCPEIGFNLKLFGKYSSPSSSEYIFTIKQCVNSSTVTCATPQQISQLFIENRNQFYLSYFYINSIVNQNNKDFMQYYLQDSQYVYFGDKIGSQAYFFLADYTISTDYSIWPFESIETITGGFMQSWMNRVYQVQSQGQFAGQYAYIRINKSFDSVTYHRHVQKISTVFSFIGGMIGAVSAILFIIKAYNSQAFEIEIASGLFTDPLQRDQLKNNNFLSYLKFNFQQILKSFKCCPKTSGFQITQKCLEEMDKQLDVKRIVQRIIFLEHCLSFLFQDYQLESILMKRPTSYQAIKKVRQRCVGTLQGIQEDISSPNNLVKLQTEGIASLATNSNIRMVPLEPKERNKGQKSHIKFESNLGFEDDIPFENPQLHLKKSNAIKSKKQILTALQSTAKLGDRISEKIYIHLYEEGAEV